MARSAWRWVVAGLVATATSGAFGSAASAAIVRVSPSSATVQAGESTQATVRVRSEAGSCVSAGSDGAGISFSFLGEVCGANRDLEVVIHTSTSTAPGTWGIVLTDEDTTRSFVLTVTAAPAPASTTTSTTTGVTVVPPPATASSSTTTVFPQAESPTTPASSSVAVSELTTTTTAASRATSSATSTVVTAGNDPGSTYASSASSTTDGRPSDPRRPGDADALAAARAPRARFEPADDAQTAAARADLVVAPSTRFPSVRSLLDVGIPARGLYLPFADGAFATCLDDLDGGGACVEPARAVTLVDAAAADVVWTPTTAGAGPDATRLDSTDALIVPAVGTPPVDRDPDDVGYEVTVLDLRAGGAATSRHVAATLDDRGLLATGVGSASTSAPPVRLTMSGAPAGAPAGATITAAPLFAEPVPVDRDDLIVTRPVLAVTGANVVQGIVPPSSWGLGRAIVPMLGAEHVAYVARNRAGTTGLYLPLPPGFQPIETTAAPDANGSMAGGATALAVLVLVLVGLAVAGVIAHLVGGPSARRRPLRWR